MTAPDRFCFKEAARERRAKSTHKSAFARSLALLSSADRELLAPQQLVHEAEEIAPKERKTAEAPSDDLMNAFRCVSSRLGDMAVHEMDAARCWAAKRDGYLDQEVRQSIVISSSVTNSSDKSTMSNS
jgi:hypothetical protein